MGIHGHGVNFSDALGSNNICKVYTESDAILGYAVFMPSVDEVELLDFAVAAEFQRKGLGRKLLFEIMDVARSMNMRRMLLEVRSSNVAARGLYDAAGFREIGLRRGYYPADNGREDAIVMEYLLVNREEAVLRELNLYPLWKRRVQIAVSGITEAEATPVVVPEDNAAPLIQKTDSPLEQKIMPEHPGELGWADLKKNGA